jgi:hypothetical protein
MFTPEEIQEIKTLYLEEFGAGNDEEIVEYVQTILNLLTDTYKD